MSDSKRIIAKDTSVIPKGSYCYRHTGKMITADKVFSEGKWIDSAPHEIPEIQMCPYWSLREDKPHMENGHCGYLESGDWESDGFSLLWDQVKECGVNDEEEDDEENGAGE